MDKAQTYQDIVKVMPSLLDDTDYYISQLGNFVALLHQSLDNVSWTGIYLYRNGELVLGPFQGKVACTKIPLTKGVCGASASTRKSIVVPNVHHFPGHIACDDVSMSEIVVPIIINNELYGVLDLDSYLEKRFDEVDQKYLEELVKILSLKLRI